MRIYDKWAFGCQSIHQSDLVSSTITMYSYLRYIYPLDRTATEELSFCLCALPSPLFSTADTHYITRKSHKRGAWLAQLVGYPALDFCSGHDFRVMGSSPPSVLGILSLPLLLFPALSL